MEKQIQKNLEALRDKFSGEIYTDNLHRIAYSTDASVYKRKPVAVLVPKTDDDIYKAIMFARENKTSVIARAAGTSVCGQVIGEGLVVDISKHFTKILEVNKEEKWVRVQPGVNLDELNMYLKQYGLFFGPETSTANRCRIGGMVGNNSCGSHSIIYGTTRDNVLEIKAFLSDGSQVEFKDLTLEEFAKKCKQTNLEGKVYSHINEILSNPKNQEEIRREYPAPSINRRNTGYAIDVVLESEPFTEGKPKFNFCKLITGSEGTLAFATEIKLKLVDAPPAVLGVVAVHVNQLEHVFYANLIALKYNPGAVELIDKYILDCAKHSIAQSKNMFFIENDPAALLVVEFARDTKEEIFEIAKAMESEMRASGYGYHFPVLFGEDVSKIWSLRKAGLGLISHVPGDAKTVELIEDTAVDVNVLPDFMKEFMLIMKRYNMNCCYYAHIGSGEIHLKPEINIKTAEGTKQFHDILEEVAHLTKKYKGSLCGEHGTGILRGQFLPYMIGDKNYQMLKDVKKAWDPDNVFNPNKVVNTPPMDKGFRYDENYKNHDIKTFFDFTPYIDYQRTIELCNGAGECRKSSVIGGTLCPSYQASGDETLTTRARANVLREIIATLPYKKAFANDDVYEVLSLCLSCKGCKGECPAGVDVAKFKAEYLQHYYDIKGVPMRSWLVANINKINSLASIAPSIYNLFMENKIFAGLVQSSIGFSTKRAMPLLSTPTMNKWLKANIERIQPKSPIKTIYLFVDEFTNFNDAEIGIKAVKLLTKLGYEVKTLNSKESGRTYISKGLARQAKKLANENIAIYKDYITEGTPLVGIEPSAILSFRDEYPELAEPNLVNAAKNLAKWAYTIDEFIAKEIDKENIKKEQFTDSTKSIKLHCHCQQKAIASSASIKKILTLPENYTIDEIPSGCCGMAGSFGYEKEHYDLSMKIGEMVLFPAVRNASQETEIAAPGTSCRHQIHDGTGRHAKHPVEILFEALK